MATLRLASLQLPLAPIPPAYCPPVRRSLELLLPLLLRLRLLRWLPAGITRLELEDGERLVALLEQFRQGRCRLLLAFRHSEVDDPLCGLWLLSRALPRRLRPQPVHFLYDRGMPLWGGRPLGWLLSRLGGVSLRRGRHPDWSALRQARQLLRDGPFPFALAPEGATNGHGEWLGPLEPGAARLALGCVSDLRRAGRDQAVWIVPIGIRYTYPHPSWPRLDRLLGRMERQLGLDPLPPLAGVRRTRRYRYRRLLRLGETLLVALESFYGHLEGGGPESATAEPPAPFSPRIAALRERALRLAEARLGLVPQAGSASAANAVPAATPEERCRRLEEAAWQWMYREDLPPRRQLAPVQRQLADWTAAEADLALRHMRLVETFVAVSGHYVAERPSFERFAETALLLHDGLARIRGGSLPGRPSLGPRRARIQVAEPIAVTAQEPAALTELLRQRLLSCLG